MKLDIQHGCSLLALSLALASACGGSEQGSTLDPVGGEGSGASSSTGGKLALGTGGDDTPGLATGGVGSGEGGADSCGSTRLEAALPSMLLVVDKSLSMNQTPDGFASNKWLALRTALETTFADAEASINFGLDLYPAVEAENCEMPSSAD